MFLLRLLQRKAIKKMKIMMLLQIMLLYKLKKLMKKKLIMEITNLELKSSMKFLEWEKSKKAALKVNIID